MIRVLFVCLGNICRSPMAEAIMRNLVEKEGLTDHIEVDSAGTGDWHVGAPPHRGTQNILTENSIKFEGIRARQVERNDLTVFDYVIAMDYSNVTNLKKLGKFQGYVGRLSDFVEASTWEDVPDPYYTGNFEETYKLVQEGCKQLLAYIRKQHSM